MPASQSDKLAELRSRISSIESTSTFAREESNSPFERRSSRPSIGSAPHRARAAKPPEPDAAHSESSSGFEDEVRNALKKIERLCAQREQASSELICRLQKDNYPLEVAEEAVSRAQSWGLVDDLRYADVHVRCRLSAGKGLSGIARELSALGIDPDEVEEYVEAASLGDEREVERALDILRRKPPRSKNVRDSAYRRLIQKGYSSSASSRAARLFCEEYAAL